MKDMNEDLIDNIITLRLFHHVYQPIYDLKNANIYAYEVLLRSKHFPNPEHLFKCAENFDRLFEMDSSSIFSALSMYQKYKRMADCKWFLNIFPSTLIHPAFDYFLDKICHNSFPYNNLIFEVNEAEHVPNMNLLNKALVSLKEKHQCSIALDDVGKGSASLRAIIELEPTYIKLDRYFAIHLSTSKRKQNMVRMLVDLCNNSNVFLVLEGIEHAIDLAVAKSLGVHLGQGFHLGKPLPIHSYLDTKEEIYFD